MTVALLYVTTRGQVDAGGSVEAALPPAVVRVKHAAQFDLSQFHHFSHVGAFVLQRQLVGVDQNRVQAALEALQDQRVLLLPRGALLSLHLVDRAGLYTVEHQWLLDDQSRCSDGGPK